MGYDKIFGGGENVSAEVNAQGPLIQEIMENLKGKVQGANATPDDILLGKSAYVGQELVKGGVKLTRYISEIKVENLPNNFDSFSAVYYHDEIHILGGYNRYVPVATGTNGHYKLDKNTKEWVSVSTLPYLWYSGCAVVYKDEIHILGGSGETGNNTKHYKLDKNTKEWVSVSKLPYGVSNGCAVVYRDEIHILGGNENHYKFDDTSWTSVSVLPNTLSAGSAIVYKDEIHTFGGGTGNKNHYKYKDGAWTSVSTLPYNFVSGGAAVHNDEIHIVGSGNSSGSYYKLNGTDWISLGILPRSYSGGEVLSIDNEIHMLGGIGDSRHNILYAEIYRKEIVEVTA